MKTVHIILLTGLALSVPALAAEPLGQGTLPATERTRSGNAAAGPAATNLSPAATTNEVPAPAEAMPAGDAAPIATTPMIEQTGFSRGSVVRSAFTTDIDNREPVDTVDQLPADNAKVYFFTELRDMTGQKARHRWEHNGEVMAEVEFDVRGPRWRVWSSKNFQPQWTGEWKVSVINAADEVIAEQKLEVVPEPAAVEPAAPAADEPAATEAATVPVPAGQ
jgi:hypothetical protein